MNNKIKDTIQTGANSKLYVLKDSPFQIHEKNGKINILIGRYFAGQTSYKTVEHALAHINKIDLTMIAPLIVHTIEAFEHQTFNRTL
jgi:hypothetical protein